MGKKKSTPAGVRKIDVGTTELREIAYAIDEYTRCLDDGADTALLSASTRLKATRERIAPLAEFPRRDHGTSLVEQAFERGREQGLELGGGE